MKKLLIALLIVSGCRREYAYSCQIFIDESKSIDNILNHYSEENWIIYKGNLFDRNGDSLAYRPIFDVQAGNIDDAIESCCNPFSNDDDILAITSFNSSGRDRCLPNSYLPFTFECICSRGNITK
jgi:hypothetical protein